MDASLAMRTSTAIMCIGLVLTTAELLSAHRIYARNGLLARDIAILQYPIVTARLGGLHGWLGTRISPFSLLLLLRLTAAVYALIVVAIGDIETLPLGVLLITTIALGLLMPFGLDGGHHMNLVLLVGLTVAAAFPEGSLAWRAGLAFITIQAVLSYVLAGIAKVTSETWRRGAAPAGIFSTDVYGHKWVYAWLAGRPLRGRAVAWATIAFECSFAAVPFVGLETAWPLLTLGLGFHVASALLMGLNGFLFAFAAAYPIIVLVIA
jgi:hypothetical protein